MFGRICCPEMRWFWSDRCSKIHHTGVGDNRNDGKMRGRHQKRAGESGMDREAASRCSQQSLIHDFWEAGRDEKENIRRTLGRRENKHLCVWPNNRCCVMFHRPLLTLRPTQEGPALGPQGSFRQAGGRRWVLLGAFLREPLHANACVLIHSRGWKPPETHPTFCVCVFVDEVHWTGLTQLSQS